MGSVVSTIGSAINSIISAIAAVLETIIGAIVSDWLCPSSLGAGYNIALISHESANLHKFAAELKTGDTDRSTTQDSAFGNPFLQITEDEVDKATDTNLKAAPLRSLARRSPRSKARRGTLLFTGATASLRGNTTTAAFSAAKFALRSLSQSLNKEFGKENIHVCYSPSGLTSLRTDWLILIGSACIATDASTSRRGEEWAANRDGSLSPESIAKSYLYLANQDRSAWTWELDLRPAHEKCPSNCVSAPIESYIDWRKERIRQRKIRLPPPSRFQTWSRRLSDPPLSQEQKTFTESAGDAGVRDLALFRASVSFSFHLRCVPDLFPLLGVSGRSLLLALLLYCKTLARRMPASHAPRIHHFFRKVIQPEGALSIPLIHASLSASRKLVYTHSLS
ncbi:hypothetical protein V8E52_004755 [Russula decolorans]